MKKLIYAGLAAGILTTGYFLVKTSAPSEDYSLQDQSHTNQVPDQATLTQATLQEDQAFQSTVPSDPNANTDGSELTESPGDLDEQGLAESEAPSVNPANNSDTPVLSLSFSEVDNNEPGDSTPVDPVFAKSGSRFNVDFEQVANLQPGNNLTIEILGQNFDANIKSISKTDQQNRYVEIKLDKDSVLADMTIYYGRKVTKGKLYTNKGAYVFQHDGKTGYLLSEEVYEKETGIADKTESPRYRDRNPS